MSTIFFNVSTPNSIRSFSIKVDLSKEDKRVQGTKGRSQPTDFDKCTDITSTNGVTRTPSRGSEGRGPSVVRDDGNDWSVHERTMQDGAEGHKTKKEIKPPRKDDGPVVEGEESRGPLS